MNGAQLTWSPIGIDQGVPQRSLLGPILFSLYTNDLPNATFESTVNMYADDTALYCADQSAIVAAEKVSQDLARNINGVRITP